MTTIFYLAGLAISILAGIGGGIYLERHKPRWANWLRGRWHDIR